MIQINLPTKQKQTENRLVVAKGEWVEEGSTMSLGLARANLFIGWITRFYCKAVYSVSRGKA